MQLKLFYGCFITVTVFQVPEHGSPKVRSLTVMTNLAADLYCTVPKGRFLKILFL